MSALRRQRRSHFTWLSQTAMPDVRAKHRQEYSQEKNISTAATMHKRRRIAAAGPGCKHASGHRASTSTSIVKYYNYLIKNTCCRASDPGSGRGVPKTMEQPRRKAYSVQPIRKQIIISVYNYNTLLCSSFTIVGARRDRLDQCGKNQSACKRDTGKRAAGSTMLPVVQFVGDIASGLGAPPPGT